MRELFETIRFSFIFPGLHSHRKSFLASEDWKIIPWFSDPNSKSPMQFLLDIFADVPGLLGECDALLLQNESDISESAQRLANATISSLQALEAWQLAWKMDNSPYPMSLAMGTPDESAVETAVGSQYTFQDLAQANEFTLYCSAKILLLRVMRTLSSLYAASTTADLSSDALVSGGDPQLQDEIVLFPAEDLQQSSLDCTNDICRSVEYLMSRSHGDTGELMLIVPLIIALTALEDGDPQKSWIQALLANSRTGLWEAASYLP